MKVSPCTRPSVCPYVPLPVPPIHISPGFFFSCFGPKLRERQTSLSLTHSSRISICHSPFCISPRVFFQLLELPASIVDCQNLEMLRLADNQISCLPEGLLTLPKLSWLALAGNPLVTPASAPAAPAWISPRNLELGAKLGQGGGGAVHRALWQREEGARTLAVAVKRFHDARAVSDGHPMHEINVGAAITHENMIRVLGETDGGVALDEKSTPQTNEVETLKPTGNVRPALVLELLEGEWSELGGLPSYETCTRDTYSPEQAALFRPRFVLSALQGVARACEHLHMHQMTHGDVYAHNTMVEVATGSPKLGDYGAAYSYAPLSSAAPLLERIEVRAYGSMVEEMAERLEDEASRIYPFSFRMSQSRLLPLHVTWPSSSQLDQQGVATSESMDLLRHQLEMLKLRCMQPMPMHRPSFAELTKLVEGMAEAHERFEKPRLTNSEEMAIKALEEHPEGIYVAPVDSD